MRSSAAAFAWEFRRRHRWGLLAVVVYLAVIAVIRLVIAMRGITIRLDSPESLAFMDVVPLASTFTYLLAVFTFGLDGDLTARRSMYPPRLFTRPTTTSALVGWPMLYGTLAMLLLWMVARLAVPWPFDVEMPAVWPGVLAASILAWTQALTWMPYPLPGLRIVVSVLLLWALDAVVFVWLYLKPSEWAMLAVLVPQLPLAYVVAHVAVGRARRGHVPSWQNAFAWLVPLAGSASRERPPWRSSAQAQAWYEWHRIGRSLPGWVAILLPFELALLAGSSNVPRLVDFILVGVLITPPFMASFSAANVRRSSPESRNAWDVSPFDGARPLTTASIVRAKLTATIWSTALAWTLVLVATPIALALTGTLPVITEQWRQLDSAVGTSRATLLALLLLAGLAATTWKQLVQGLFLGLSGRPWLIKGSVFVTLLALFLLGPISAWFMEHDAARGVLWNALPLLLAGLTLAKVSAAAWAAVRLQRRGLLRDGVLLLGAAAWCTIVLVLYAALAWFMDSSLIPRYVLALIAIAVVPLARLSAAPLAFAWNRHR